jgi:hypothetical protein
MDDVDDEDETDDDGSEEFDDAVQDFCWRVNFDASAVEFGLELAHVALSNSLKVGFFLFRDDDDEVESEGNSFSTSSSSAHFPSFW